MSFIGLCITCAVAFVVLFGVLRGLSFFLERRIKNGYQLELPTFLFGSAALFGVVCLAVFGVALYPFGMPDSLNLLAVGALALGTVFVIDKLVSSSVCRYGLLFFLCLMGTFLIPQTAPLWTVPFGWLLCVPLAVLWLGFMAMMVVLDRVMLLAFLTHSALIAGIVLLSSAAFPFFPPVFNSAYLILLFLMLGLVYYLKNNGCYILGRPAVLFVSYLIGYAGVVMAADGYGLYVPIFISYELFEICLAMGANFWAYKKFVPIESPFMIERALIKNIAPTKALRSVFMWCIFFPLLGIVAVFAPARYIFPSYVFVGLCLYNIYTRLRDWGQPKVRFRDLFSDIKKGVTLLKEDAQKALRQPQKTPNKKKKK